MSAQLPPLPSPSQANPANVSGQASTVEPQRRRIPLSVPRRKLEVDEIPGFVLYWFLEVNVQAAIDAGYDFVNRSEVRLNQHGLASSSDASGNTDLGSRVSVIGNKSGEEGRPERLVLMKIREDWWKEDRKLLDDRNAQVIETIFFNNQPLADPGANPSDRNLVYTRTNLINGSGKLLNRGLKKRV